MSTNWVVAVAGEGAGVLELDGGRAVFPKGDEWMGRFVHWDGHPLSAGLELRAIVRREGFEAASRVLVGEVAHWSAVDADAALGVSRLRDPASIVPGFGFGAVRCSEETDPRLGRLIRSSDADKWGAEWVYVLTPHHLTVRRVVRLGLGVYRDGFVESIPWTASLENFRKGCEFAGRLGDHLARVDLGLAARVSASAPTYS